MDNLSHGRVIGIDVSRDWLDLHCLPDGHRARMPNAPAGHAAVADLASVNADLIFPRSAKVKFPTTAVSAISRFQ
jgi:hypothetical protein